jgi:hypothetical protein
MPKLATTLLSLALMLTSGIAAAQVDTGGGMGGTGIKDKHQLLDEAGLQKRAECPLESAVGIAEIKRIGEKESIEKKPVCANDSVVTKINETAVIYFRSGLIIEIKPSSSISINSE